MPPKYSYFRKEEPISEQQSETFCISEVIEENNYEGFDYSTRSFQPTQRQKILGKYDKTVEIDSRISQSPTKKYAYPKFCHELSALSNFKFR